MFVTYRLRERRS